MKKTESTTALLFFSRTPEAESQHKVVYPGNRQKNRAVINLLFQQSRIEAENSGFDVIHFDETRQKGKTFGEKLANAFQCLFDEGYTEVISIGNDCPHIGKVKWVSISENIAKHGAVIGPTPAGGAYLIGLNTATFSFRQLANLPWQSSSLFRQLALYTGHRCSAPVILTRKGDINHFLDLQNFLRSNLFSDNRLKRELAKVCATSSFTEHVNMALPVYHSTAITARAPPIQ